MRDPGGVREVSRLQSQDAICGGPMIHQSQSLVTCGYIQYNGECRVATLILGIRDRMLVSRGQSKGCAYEWCVPKSADAEDMTGRREQVCHDARCRAGRVLAITDTAETASSHPQTQLKVYL